MGKDDHTGRITEADVYAAVAARRTNFDTMLWQVPALNVAAQGFLMGPVLSADAPDIRVLCSSLASVLIALLCLNLIARHRMGEVADARWLENLEKDRGLRVAHGRAWRDARARADADIPLLVVPASKPRAFRLALLLVTLLAVPALVRIVLLTIAWMT